MSFNAKSEILSAIAKTDDPAMKTVLLLLLGVFEEIGSKIDNILGNERALRETVLNGHEPVHHHHHEWLSERIKRDDHIEKIIEWVDQKCQEEADDKASGRKIRDGVMEKIIGAAIVAGISFLIGMSWK